MDAMKLLTLGTSFALAGLITGGCAPGTQDALDGKQHAPAISAAEDWNADSVVPNDEPSPERSVVPNSLILCEDLIDGQPYSVRSVFDVQSTVYAFVRWELEEPGLHDIVIDWMGPDMTLRESYQTTVDLPRGKGATWSWLAFSAGALNGSFRNLGKWTAKVSLDGEPFDSKTFLVLQ